jgi:N-acetylmuramoyl-L-alanine amidase
MEATIPLAALPLGPGDQGPAVRDLTSRLRSLGYTNPDLPGEFAEGTEAAVRSFQADHGLEPSGVCDQHTWAALVEAGFGLGDRLLCLTSPMMRGDDVARLQLELGALGFDAGRVDGIFGPMTQRALTEFQQNVGLVIDDVCGPETVAALRRLRPQAGTGTVAGVRERHELRQGSRAVDEIRVAIVHLGEAETVAGMVGADLRRLGADATVISDSEWSNLAQRVNEFDAQLCIAIVVADEPVQEVAFFETEGFSSHGGRRLGQLVLGEFPRTPVWTIGSLIGMRLPILRETKPPTVRIKIGPPEQVAEQRALLVSALARSIERWVSDPV